MENAIQVAQISLAFAIVIGLAGAIACGLALAIYYTWRIIK